MASNIIAPTREEMRSLGFSQRVQVFLEDVDNFNTESNDENDSALSLLASSRAVIGILLSEIYSLKGRIEDLENGAI